MGIFSRQMDLFCRVYDEQYFFILEFIVPIYSGTRTREQINLVKEKLLDRAGLNMLLYPKPRFLQVRTNVAMFNSNLLRINIAVL
jgi:hypothetical protein